MRQLAFSALSVTLLISAVAAYVDFRGMGGSPRQQILDGFVHMQHEVHQQFDDGNTFFRAQYTAKHDSKWHFVELNDWMDMTHLHCGASASELAITRPSADLLTALTAHGFANTVITAHPKHSCGGQAIFRKLLGVDDEGSRVVLRTAPTTYMEVFRDLDLIISTNHVHAVSALQRTAASLQRPAARGFKQQSIWGDITSDASTAVSDAASGVESAVSGAESDVAAAESDVAAAESDAAVIGGIAVGDYSTTKAWNLPGCNYNKDVSDAFTDWDIVDSNAKVAVSFDFQPTVNLVLSISSWTLQNVEVYFEGDINAGVTGKFSSTISQSYSNSKQITVINLSPITFAIGAVPIVLTPSIPINAGYTASINGELTLTAVVSASSSVSYGFGYSPSTGHRTISDHSWSYNYDFNPKSFSLTVGLKAYVQPVLSVNIDYIGNVGLGAAIYGDVVVQSNGDCLFDLTINAQPVISVTASIGITLLDHNIFSDSWGPYSLWSAKYPLYSYCLPTPSTSDAASGSAGNAPAATSGAGSAGNAPAATSGAGSAGNAPAATSAAGSAGNAPAATSGAGSAGNAPAATSGAGSAGNAPAATSGAGSAGNAPAATSGAGSAGNTPAATSGAGSAGNAPAATSGAGSAGNAPAATSGAGSAGNAPAPAPASGSGSAGGRRFDAQSTTSSASSTTGPSNRTRPHVTRTVHTVLGAGNVGKVWSGRSVSCGAFDMSYSLQFDVDSQRRSIMHLVVTKSTVAPQSHGLISALAHLVYSSPSLPSLGSVMTFTLNTSAPHYLAASNPTQLSINPPATMTLTFSPSDTRFLSMDSAVTCGAVSLTAAESNNDNTTLTIFASGRSRRSADVQSEALRASSAGQLSGASTDSQGQQTAVAVYAVVASVCAVVALAAALIVYRRARAPAPTGRSAPTTFVPEAGTETLHSIMLTEAEVPLAEVTGPQLA